MPDIYLYQGEASPNDIKLRNPTTAANLVSLVATAFGSLNARAASFGAAKLSGAVNVASRVAAGVSAKSALASISFSAAKATAAIRGVVGLAAAGTVRSFSRATAVGKATLSALAAASASARSSIAGTSQLAARLQSSAMGGIFVPVTRALFARSFIGSAVRGLLSTFALSPRVTIAPNESRVAAAPSRSRAAQPAIQSRTAQAPFRSRSAQSRQGT